MSSSNCRKCSKEFGPQKTITNYVYDLCKPCFESRKDWAVLSRKCLLCQQHLVVIGDRRKNGVGHDWDARYLHKKCMKDVKEMKQDFHYYH